MKSLNHAEFEVLFFPMMLILKGIFVAVWYCRLLLMNFVLVMNVDGVSQPENRSETDRPGLPHAAQTKRMLWGGTVDDFWSKKLVDQDGTVCAHAFIGGSHN